MPFVSKDWRSPGELWIRCDGGWKMKKALGNSRNSWNVQLLFLSYSPDYHIAFKKSKEITGSTDMAEALDRLDFLRALKDTRHISFIAQILETLLSSSHFSNYSGSAQRNLLRVLEEMTKIALENKANVHLVKGLFEKLKAQRIRWTGNSVLLHNYSESQIRIQNLLETKSKESNEKNRETENTTRISCLPEDCLSEILLRLSDHKDLNSVSNSSSYLASIVSQQRIWKELSFYHFTPLQLRFVISKKTKKKIENEKESHKENWKEIYRESSKNFTSKETLPHVLSLCKICSRLFWKFDGHTCYIESHGNLESQSTMISPQTFVSFFSS